MYTQNFIFAIPDKARRGQFILKDFCQELHKISRDVLKSHVFRTFHPIGWGQFTNFSLPGSVLVSRSALKCWQTPHP